MAANQARAHGAHGDRAIRVLAVSGSLRAQSTSAAVLDAAALVAPAHVRVARYERLAELPPFNPDVEATALPAEVATWRRAIGESDALLIASPEYAHGVPGALKNALDWLVGGSELVGKCVAVLNPSARSRFAHPQLVETLRTMSGAVVEEASVTLPFGVVPSDGAALAADPTYGAVVRGALDVLLDAVARRGETP